MCAKEKECNSGTADDEKECLDACNNIKSKGYYQDTFIKAVNDCYGKTCSEIDNCLDKSYSSCKTPDYMPYINAACEKMVSCGGSGSKEECVSSGKESIEKEINNSPMKCTTDRLFDDLGSCISKANCSFLDEDINKCMEDTIGK